MPGHGKNLDTAPAVQIPDSYMLSRQPGLKTTSTNSRCAENFG